MRTDNQDDKGIGYWLTHPGTAAGALFATFGSSFDLLDPLVSGLASTADLWYPLVATLWRVADLVPIPAGVLEQAFIAAALVYVGLLAADLIQSLTDDSDS